jgi:organic hydroperoxide reductase OsmC/OhrA
MAKVLYTAEATVTGGRAEGHGRTSDGALDVRLRLPAEMGGNGGGTNPEQLFAIGDVSIDSGVSLLSTEDGGFKLAVTLDVSLPQVEDDQRAVRIVAAAHEVCPYSNATRGNIDVALTANGHAVT